MPVTIAIPKETTPGERRVAMIPEVVKKFKALGAQLYAQAQLVCKVQSPSLGEISAMAPGSILIGFLQPYSSKERIAALKAKNITSFAVELIPRISRAQSMDGLSSQAACSGYQCVLIAADHCPKFFPMLTYAAG